MKAFLGSLMLLMTLGVNASELVYTPVNPSFGGNALNGTFLINSAQAQNDLTDPSLDDEDSPLDDFNDSLLRSLLSRITSAWASSIVDSDGTLQPGVFNTGDYTIEIAAIGNDEVRITTTDNITGESTTFVVNQPSSSE